MINEDARHGDLCLCLSQLEARVLKIENGLAKGMPVAYVIDRAGQNAFRAGHGSNGDHKTLSRQMPHQQTEPLFGLTEEAFDRNAYVIKEYLGRVLRPQPKFVESAAAHEAPGSKRRPGKVKYLWLQASVAFWRPR